MEETVGIDWDRWDHNNRYVYNTYNNNYYNYPSNDYPSNTNISRRGASVNSNTPAGNASRREGTNRSNVIPANVQDKQETGADTCQKSGHQ